MSSRELVQWMEYDRVHGLPDRRLEASIAIAGAVVANGTRTKPIKPEDLIPDFRPRPPQSYDVFRTQFGAWARAHNRKFETQKRGRRG